MYTTVLQGGEALRAHASVRAAAVAGLARHGPPARSPQQQRRRHDCNHARGQQLAAGAKPGAAGPPGLDARARAGDDASGAAGEGGTGLRAGSKRARYGDGSPGTPLLGAGLAAEPERRTRQRGDQARCAWP